MADSREKGRLSLHALHIDIASPATEPSEAHQPGGASPAEVQRATAEWYVDEAYAEAERIKEDARLEAEQIQASAHLDMERQAARAQKAAYESGLQEAMEAGRHVKEEIIAQALAKAQEIENEAQRKRKAMLHAAKLDIATLLAERKASEEKATEEARERALDEEWYLIKDAQKTAAQIIKDAWLEGCAEAAQVKNTAHEEADAIANRAQEYARRVEAHSASLRNKARAFAKEEAARVSMYVEEMVQRTFEKAVAVQHAVLDETRCLQQQMHDEVFLHRIRKEKTNKRVLVKKGSRAKKPRGPDQP